MRKYLPRAEEVPRYVAGLVAVSLALFFLTKAIIQGWHDSPLVLVSGYLIMACAIDTLKSRIPNLLNAGLASAGLLFFFYHDGWSGLLTSVMGLALGVGLLLLPWLMDGMGAGDVKALGALGAVLGPEQIFYVFIYMGLYGGLLAVLHYLFARNLKAKSSEWLSSLKAIFLTKDPSMIIPTITEPLRFPYAAAIAFGYYTYLTYGGVF